MKMIGKIGNEAGGTFSEPIFVFIVAACSTENVESWAKQQFRTIVQQNIGRIFRTTFTSSSSSTEHFIDSFSIALLRNLSVVDGV